ncbi:MAG: ion channel [Gammaproteobacteria bacterium]|nr:ion channel [Gammaproteobacteria bacterium]
MHVVEIGMFASVFASLSGTASGSVQGAETFLDHMYFSGPAYTTLGIGDLVPLGALRTVTAAEAIAGLVFIAWSASFAFIQMRRAWGEEATE